MQAELRLAEKERLQEQKEKAKQDSLEEQAKRFETARSSMMRTVRENGGSFHNLTSAQDVSKQVVVIKKMKLI